MVQMKLIRKRRNGYALIIRSRYLFGGVARCNFYVRSGFRFWSYQPYLSPVIG